MRYELAGIHNGVELYNPVAESEQEERQLKINEEIFYKTLADLIIKYGPKVLAELKLQEMENIKYLSKDELTQVEISCYLEQMISDETLKFTKSDIYNDDFPYDDADVFRQGSCQLFAFELHRKFGYPVYKIEAKGSFHIFCKSIDEKKYIDVRGVSESFSDFILGSELPFVDRDTSTPYEFVSDDFETPYSNIGQAFARAIISRDEKRYII